MSIADLRLHRVLQRTIEAALAGSPDRLIRLDLPPTWPVQQALLSLDISGPLRVGAMLPFRSDQLSDLEGETRVTLSTRADEMTRWRDPDGDLPPGTTILLGSATSSEESGLIDPIRRAGHAEACH